MGKVSGFSFKKSNDGDVIGIAGKKELPHRIEKIRQAINKNFPPDEINRMFFNFDLKDCRVDLTKEELEEELILFKDWDENLFAPRMMEYNEINFQKALKQLEAA